MSARIGKRRKRPTYPSATRQGVGIIFSALSILGVYLYGRYHHTQSQNDLILLAVLITTYWSGLRAGMISVGMAMGYFMVHYALPGTFLHYTPQIRLGLVSAAFILAGLTLALGLIQSRVRNAGMREFDAHQVAEIEFAQRQHTQDELRSSEELRRLVVESATDAIIVADQTDRITLWNPQAEAIFGWSNADAIGRGVSETILPSANSEPGVEGFRRFIDSEQQKSTDWRVELSAVTKDGREIPIELTVVPYDTDSGRLYIGFARDLTEERKLNERLRQAQKLEAIGTLAAGIAHDFNNILTSVSGNLALARADIPQGHVAQESLAEGEKAVARAADVVRQILTFSSVREERADAIDVAATLGDAVQLLRATIPATTEILAHFEPDLPAINADITDIHQLVLNLGINAHAALGDQPGKFELQVTRITLDEQTARTLLKIEPGEFVRMSFGDTGSGMDKATLDRIFEPFFTTKPHGEGTGLGLSVVFGIVERHGGAISVYSEPTKGTVFHIYFPAIEKVAEKATKVAINSVERGNGERILYVDDDDALVYMMTRMLRRLNYEVVGFLSSREALDVFKATPDAFDLVITDMSMPHLDGPSLVGELQAIRPDLPIVMVTGYIRPKDLEQASRLGIRELLLKPNSVQEMGETVHRVLTELRSETGSNGPYRAI